METELQEETATGSPLRAGKKRRVQLEFSSEAYEKLQTLRREQEASSNAATIRNALAVLEWVMQAEKAGQEILVRDSGSDETERVKFLW